MTQNVVTSNGWDLIAAATQDAVNAQLAKLPEISVNRKVTIPFLGVEIVIGLEISLGPPQLRIREGSGRQVDVLMPLSGNISFMDGTVLQMSPGEKLVVTTELTQIKAEIQLSNEPNQTTYHLIIDFESSNAIVDITATLDPIMLASLVQVLKQVVKHDIGNGFQYELARFTLTEPLDNKYQALIPHVADFSFVRDPNSPGRSNFLVLMQTVSQIKGNIYFGDSPLLASDQNFAFILSNKVFLQYFILPKMISQIQGEAKNSSAVSNQVQLHSVPQQPFMYEVANTGDIPLNKDHDPWISQITASIDTSMQALCLYLDAQDDVTFANFHIDAWARSWQQFRVDATSGNISIKEIKNDKNHSTTVDWWEWLIAIVLGPIALITTAIIDAVVSGNTPDVGGSFSTLGQNFHFQWPFQNTLMLKQITTPNHVVLTVDVSFQQKMDWNVQAVVREQMARNIADARSGHHQLPHIPPPKA